jgi:hypothetical protein
MAGCLQGLKGAVLHEPVPRLRRQGRTPGHPDLNGFGADGWMFLWLQDGAASPAPCM